VFVLYLALGSPLDLLAHLLFSAHMISMALAFLIAPPLIMLGIPGWMVRPLTNDSWFQAFLKINHPIVTVLLFNVLFSFYHMPAIHDYVMTHFTVHTVYYIVLMISAFMMWWPIASPLPELVNLSSLRKIFYIMANGVLLTPACAFIIFAGEPLFATYTDPETWARALAYCAPGDPAQFLQQFSGPQYFYILPARDDQQLGGIAMKIIQEIMYAAMLAHIFFKSFIKENAGEDQTDHPTAEFSAAKEQWNRV
jgi:putative membrane protein